MNEYTSTAKPTSDSCHFSETRNNRLLITMFQKDRHVSVTEVPQDYRDWFVLNVLTKIWSDKDWSNSNFPYLRIWLSNLKTMHLKSRFGNFYNVFQISSGIKIIFPEVFMDFLSSILCNWYFVIVKGNVNFLAHLWPTSETGTSFVARMFSLVVFTISPQFWSQSYIACVWERLCVPCKYSHK